MCPKVQVVPCGYGVTVESAWTLVVLILLFPVEVAADGAGGVVCPASLPPVLQGVSYRRIHPLPC